MRHEVNPRTPCCNRLMHFEASDSTTCVYTRKCPRCDLKWSIVVRPDIPLASGRGVMNRIDWTLTPAPESDN